VFILSILFIVIALSVILYFLNNQQFSGQSRSVQLTSREGFLLLNNLLLCGVLSIVVIGTLYPTFLDVLTGKKISVGSPYFNISTMPFVLLVGLLIPFAVASSYKNGNLNVVLSHLKYIGIIALGAAIAISLILNHIPFMAAAMFAIGIWLIIMNSYFLVRQIKMNVIPQNLAHIALGIIMLGIGGTSLTKEKIISVKMNDSFNIADLKVSVENRETLKEHNYLAEKTYLKVVDKNNKEIILVPERRFYPTAKQTTTEADIRLFYWGDIYVATGEQQLDGGHTLRFWIHPFISCLWLGTSLLVLAGLLGLFTRRRTI
jgi:cytochrome c-type biogenesis protein CcmF